MRTRILAAALSVAAVAMAVTTIAVATAVPDLPDGVHQAYLADGEGEPEHATITLSGTLSTAGAITVTCSNAVTATLDGDGTVTVTAFTPTGCVVVGWPNCPVSFVAENLDFGGRLGFDTRDSPNAYRLFLNVAFNLTYGASPPTCPWAGTFTQSGTFSPTIAVAGGTLTATFSGTAGSLTGPLGATRWIGTLASTSGVGSETQLIY